jgi:beta-lactamase class D
MSSHALAALVVLAIPAVSLAAGDPQLAEIFARHRARGTLVIAALRGGTQWVHGPARARTRFSPASTFKVGNSLIALHLGVIDERQVLRWDGKDRGRQEWNQDHTLESALRVSCVWCYQALARRIGAARYRELLSRIGYGNAIVGKDVTTFWLDGSLQISALEQIAFLRAVAERKLPFKAAAYDALARIMVLEKTPRYVLRAKTGWSKERRPELGWLIGEVTVGDQWWLFAMNVDLMSDADAPKRLAITRDALKAKRILP